MKLENKEQALFHIKEVMNGFRITPKELMQYLSGDKTPYSEEKAGKKEEIKTITPWVCKYCERSNPEENINCKHCNLDKRK